MIPKLKIIGECIDKHEGNQNPLNVKETLQEANVVLMDFHLSKDDCRFMGTTTMQYDPEKKNSLLLLKDIKGNDVSSFPTVYIDSSSVEKSYDKIIRILKNCSLTNPAFNLIDKILVDEKDTIIQSIGDIIDDNQKNLCTVRINLKLVGDSEYFEPVMAQYQKTIWDSCYKKHNTESMGTNNKCYVCGKESNITFGFCSTYKFYSSNETAYIAGGFTREDSWKNYPVCPSCASYLHLGKEWVSANMNRYFHGNTYLLIPSPTINQNGFYPMLKIIRDDFRDLSLRQSQESN
ncbi:MAG: TM1802 family CRISPR-associated protein, partial [bacterium]